MSANFTANAGEIKKILQNSDYISLTVNSPNADVSAEVISTRSSSTHQQHIGLDCRLSCRLWAVGKQITMPSEIINHSKPTLKCFAPSERYSNWNEITTVYASKNMQLQAQQHWDRWLNAVNVHVHESLSLAGQFMVSGHRIKHISIIHTSVALLTADSFCDYALQVFLSSAIQWVEMLSNHKHGAVFKIYRETRMNVML